MAQTVKASAYNAGDPGLIPGSGRSPGLQLQSLLSKSQFYALIITFISRVHVYYATARAGIDWNICSGQHIEVNTKVQIINVHHTKDYRFYSLATGLIVLDNDF